MSPAARYALRRPARTAVTDVLTHNRQFTWTSLRAVDDHLRWEHDRGLLTVEAPAATWTRRAGSSST
ncbi:hypothetical protein ACWC4C_43470 [Streptomyces olivaceoviridis]